MLQTLKFIIYSSESLYKLSLQTLKFIIYSSESLYKHSLQTLKFIIYSSQSLYKLVLEERPQRVALYLRLSRWGSSFSSFLWIYF